jgi:predicted outer membrane repeat protein
LDERKRRPPASRKARFEPLEDRTLLAVLTVNSPLENNTPGDGLVTLREAIRAANQNTTTDLGQTGSGADTIQIASSVTGTISIVFGEFVISESLTIVGPGQDVLTIDAHDASRIFNFTAQSGDFTLSDLTLTRGRVQGNTTLGGAGINKGGTGLLKLERVNITECTAVYTGSFNFAHGGAVSVEGGTLTVVSSLLSGNQASGTAARGGAIASRARIVNIIDSVIENNKAMGSGQGGGIHAQYYSLADSPVELTLTGSTIRGNTAGSGGGIYVNRAGVIIGGTISDNQASNGGGIYASSGVVLQRVTVHGNSSASMGGGVRSGGGGTVESSTISGNTSGGGEGGLYCRVGGFVLSNSTIS